MKKLICLLSIILLTLQIFGQNEMNNNYWKILCFNPGEFANVVDSFNLYIERNYSDSIKEENEIYIKDYYRFINFWQHRLGLIESETSYLPYLNAVQDYMLSPVCDSEDSASWQIIGPVQYPNDQYLGLVSEVLSDPQNPNSYLLSSELGGIWKRYEESDAWVNVTDDLRIPGLSTTEIIRNPFNHDHIIASTGGGLSGNYADYGMGIIESFDNGDSWTIMQGFDNSNYPYVVRVIADPNDNNPNDGLTLYAVTKRTIFSSNNTGGQWVIFNGPSSLNENNYYQDIEIDNLGSIYVSSQNPWNDKLGQVFKYDGTNWSDLSIKFHSGLFGGARITKPHEGKIFVMADYPVTSGPNTVSKRQIYKSDDYGENWQTFYHEMEGSPKNEIEYSLASHFVWVGQIGLTNICENNPNLNHQGDIPRRMSYLQLMVGLL